ncbi:sulfotransferase [Streptomyces roseoverticillatus]|uniref:sulfotransferase family protein n=1 Tax=Streptomyces roseoverticillatus TaxID=66429 RepID=UPI001F183D6C|nr:sulfotransferase [Streptomyces roseoverticillatus]MCF3105591.1 sulfotransferase [Streptomyces roseoverticillatus]
MRSVTFVVGSGRSGSTALSRIVCAHPDLLSLNEFWASVGTRALPGRPVDGAEFWRLVADPHPAFDSMVRSGMPIAEFLHPRAARRDEGAGIPALSLMVLPHLTDDPDGFFEELKGSVVTWPRRTAPEHHEELFEVLCARFGRTAVVERSGYSGHRVPQLHAAFPGAKFVHMFRDGPDCALSMSRHPGFRLILLRREIQARTGAAHADVALTEEQVRSLPPELAGLLSVPFDPALVLDRPLPVAEFGTLWSQIVTEAAAHLGRLPQELWMPLAYEDLLDAPRRELSRLAAFFGVEPLPQWLDAGCAMLDGSRRGASLRLPPGELAALRGQCAPGMRALKASGGPSPTPD